MTGGPNLFTIPAGLSFVDALARSLVAGISDDPAALARHLILLPNRRSVRALSEAFLRASEGKPLLLPRIGALGDLDETDISGLGDPGILDLPPAMPETERMMLLSRLVLEAGGRGPGTDSPAAAIGLARALGRLIDMLHVERIPAQALKTLVPDELAIHWQKTLDFLDIVISAWPAILAGRGMIDAADRRNRLLAALATRWCGDPPDHPVIAAGTTGSIPATAGLLKVIAHMKNGAVILPGFDHDHDMSRDGVPDPVHPNFLMNELIALIGALPVDVRDWQLTAQDRAAAEAMAPRLALLRASLRPASHFGGHMAEDAIGPGALDGLDRIAFATPREEAVALALLLREALETPGLEAALVTPDRALARQVRAELGRYGIAIDDSAGIPLAETGPGAFLRLLVAAAADGFGPVSLLAVLRHPLAAASGAPADLRRLLRAVDARSSRTGDALRGPRPASGLDALIDSARSAGLEPLQLAAFSKVLDILKPLEALFSDAGILLSRALESLVAVAETLAASDDMSGPERLWRGEAGEAMASLLREIASAAAVLPPISGEDLPALFDALLAEAVVRPRYGRHPRLRILGTIEARLQHADLMLLAGLNEGVWPPAPPHDPWMSRAMRTALGIASEEQRIGQSAHDYLAAATAPRVVLSRAGKSDGAPTLESRWLTRLEVLAGRQPGLEMRLRRLMRHLDLPSKRVVSKPPAPCPPAVARPRRLSVTEVERLMRDPYALYARRILGLIPLAPLEEEPGAAARGSIMHDALDLYAREARPDMTGAERRNLITDAGRRAFGSLLDRPGVRAFWWPRYLRIGKRFLEIETERAPEYEIIATEIMGELMMPLPGDFLLVAKADRIDRSRADGTIHIIDYKTGTPPSGPQIEAGFAPQLPLEGWMAEEGAFKGLAKAEVGGLGFWYLKGTREPVAIRNLKDISGLIDEARQGVKALISRFLDPGTPFLSKPDPRLSAYDDYDHLARIAEWTSEGQESME